MACEDLSPILAVPCLGLPGRAVLLGYLYQVRSCRQGSTVVFDRSGSAGLDLHQKGPGALPEALSSWRCSAPFFGRRRNVNLSLERLGSDRSIASVTFSTPHLDGSDTSARPCAWNHMDIDYNPWIPRHERLMGAYIGLVEGWDPS